MWDAKGVWWFLSTYTVRDIDKDNTSRIPEIIANPKSPITVSYYLFIKWRNSIPIINVPEIIWWVALTEAKALNSERRVELEIAIRRICVAGNVAMFGQQTNVYERCDQLVPLTRRVTASLRFDLVCYHGTSNERAEHPADLPTADAAIYRDWKPKISKFSTKLLTLFILGRHATCMTRYPC